MADAFAPQLGTEVRFNQPVETPSAFGALANLGSFFVGNLADSQRGQATAAPKVDNNLATFRSGLEKVEAIRQERGETAAQVAERQLASNFAMAGINLDKAYEDVYTTTTGRQWAGYGQDVEATMLQKALDDTQVQASYLASFAVNKDWNEEQRIEYAIGQKATLQAAESEIAKSKAQAGYQWSVQTEAAYGTAVDTFLNTSLGALAAGAQQGARVSPMDVQNLKAQWGQLRIQLSRPSNISDDQWKATQDKFANVDNLLTTFEKASGSAMLLDELSVAISNAITQGKEGDLQAMVAGAIAAKDITTFANLNGVDFATILMDAGKSLNVKTTQQDLFGHILDSQGSLTDIEDPNSFLSTIPDTVKASIEGKTPEQIFNGLDASGKLAGLVKPADLNRPDAKEQFVTNAATIGAVLMNNPSEQFLSDSALKQLIANPGFIRNVLALDAIDPEGATVARQYVRSGLNTERGRQVTNFGTIEAFLSDKGIVWNGNAYELSPEAQDIAGAVTAPGRRGFAPMPTIAGMAPLPMDPLQEFSGVIKQAMDRRSAIGTIDKAMKALEVPTEETATRAGGAGGGSSSTSSIVSVVDAGKGFTTVRRSDGTVEKLEGTRAWRNNNPGNIEYGEFAKSSGAVGSDGRFAVFPSYEAGRAAKKKLLWDTKGYSGKTIAEAINRYAPPSENDTNAYASTVSSAVGVPIDTPMSSLSEDQKEAMLDAMERVEGFRAGQSSPASGGTAEAPQGRPSDSNAVASRAGEAVQRAVAPSGGTPSSDMTMPSGGAPTAPMEAATATLPEAISTEAPTGLQNASELSPAIAVDKDVQAFIQEIAGDPDKTFASEAEFNAAQERGELEPGDTVVVNEEIYVVRKNGSVRRLGRVTP